MAHIDFTEALDLFSRPMAPTPGGLTLGLMGGLGDAIGGYPEAEPVPSTASPELPSGGGAITSMPSAHRFPPPWMIEEHDKA